MVAASHSLFPTPQDTTTLPRHIACAANLTPPVLQPTDAEHVTRHDVVPLPPPPLSAYSIDSSHSIAQDDEGPGYGHATQPIGVIPVPQLTRIVTGEPKTVCGDDLVGEMHLGG